MFEHFLFDRTKATKLLLGHHQNMQINHTQHLANNGLRFFFNFFSGIYRARRFRHTFF